MMKAIYISLIAALAASIGTVAGAQTASEKPPTFDACMQADTPDTISRIYSACMKSAQSSDLRRYVLDAKYAAQSASSDNIQKLHAETKAAKNPHHYFGALARMRQSEILSKTETAKSISTPSAKQCWHAQQARFHFGYYTGTSTGHAFADRKLEAANISAVCAGLPRQTFDAAANIPDSGDLLADIPEYEACMRQITRENIFELHYACRIADSKLNIVSFRKAMDKKNGIKTGQTPLADVYIAAARTFYRKAEITSQVDPKNGQYMCNIIDSVLHNFEKSKLTPAAESADFQMVEKSKQLQAGCQQRKF